MVDCSDTINALIDAVEAIEHELGVTPSSVYANVRARLDILESRINNPLTINSTINFGTVGATSRAIHTTTVSGALIGHTVVVNPRNALPSSIQIDYCRISASDTVEIAIYNRSGSGVAVNQSFDITLILSS